MPPPVKPFIRGDDSDTIPPSTNLWVGNLPVDATDGEVMELFAAYGTVDNVATYSARSFAFVYYKRVEDSSAAKDALQGHPLRGHPLKIEFARPAKPCKCLWVGAIGPAVSKEELEEEFMKFGKIEDFKFFRDRNSALVEFVKLDDALQAMKNLNRTHIGGEEIRVDFLRSQPSRRDSMPDFRDSRDGQFFGAQFGSRRIQHPSLGARRESQPSNTLWVGYPPSLQIDEQMLHNAMILFGEIERVKSFPSRNYSFVEFRSVDEARRAKEGLEGRLFNDPRITIMYSSSGQGAGKEFSSFYPGAKGPRPDMLNEPVYGSEMFDRHMGFSTPEFNDLPPGHAETTWRRPSSGGGILPSPGSRVKPVRSASSGWDVVDTPQIHRLPKRSRTDPAYADEDSFSPGNYNDNYGLGPPMDLGPGFTGVHRRNSLSPVGFRGAVAGPNQGPIDHDFIWRGTIAKGGTPVCHARCVPLGNGIESELPQVVNCSARTGLDMLAKHYAEAIAFDIVFFLPDSEDDFASYTEFLRYLGSKNRAGVAKFDDGTTLFLVPPSDFLTKVLKVKGPERLYGVVLKLPQQGPTSASLQPQLHQPFPHSQYIDRHHMPPPEDNYSFHPQNEETMMPISYGGVLHEDSNKPPSKSFYQPTNEPGRVSSLPQDYTPMYSGRASQSGVSLTPELIATLTSILPVNTQSSTSDAGQLAAGPGSSYSAIAQEKGTPLQGWKHDNQLSGTTNNLQVGNQFTPNMQAPTYPTFSNIPGHAGQMVHNLSQMHDSSAGQPLGVIPPRPLMNMSQSAHFTSSPQVGQHYPSEASHSAQMGHDGVQGNDVPASYGLSVGQQFNSPAAFTGQVQVSNYQTHPGIHVPAGNVNLEIPNQGQPFQNSPVVAPQGTSDGEADKNQRYQSTLQFAANLLLQIQQQQQQQQTSNSAARGSGNQ